MASMAFTTTFSTRLLQQVAVHAHFRAFGFLLHADADPGGIRLRPGQFHDLADQFLQRHVARVQFHRAGEIEERLHHAVQPQNLARNDLHLRPDIGIAAGQFGARHLHVQQDGVQRDSSLRGPRRRKRG